jgi:hypothetical protein
MKRSKKPPPRYVSRARLPKKIDGAYVIRALAMDYEKFNALKKKAIGQFDATADLYLVVDESALKDSMRNTYAFREKNDAIRYARAVGNGNVDHRVLRVTEQMLVVATENAL